MAEAEEFKLGETVRLKSGSPVMTISGEKNSGGEYYWEFWNPQTYKVEGLRLSHESLAKVASRDSFPVH